MAESKNNYFYALGRRKRATAQVRLRSGKGTIIINNQPAAEYFAESKYLLHKLEAPFRALSQENKYAIEVKVTGGGQASQADAIQLGIAKSLSVMNEDFRSTLRRAELLSRDPRERERKKFGLKSARKQRQFTKR